MKQIKNWFSRLCQFNEMDVVGNLRITPDKTLFREYDIRGIYQETLWNKDAWLIGYAFGQLLAADGVNGPVVIARDGRLSSPSLEEMLIKGLMYSGRSVVRLGLGPTPWLYYVTYNTGAAGGIMVTGSHNPANHNGFKFMYGKSPFFGEHIQQLAQRIEENNGSYPAHKAITATTAHSTALHHKEEYIHALVKAFKPRRSLKVAWDAGNGAAGEIVAQLCQRLPGEHIPLYTVVDGTFPNHHPDPTIPENLVDLIRTVREQECDLGIAFDGDGDRLGVVDHTGRIIWGDQLLLLLSKYLLKNHKGATIIADVKASQILFDGIRHAGGVPLMWKTGHSHIKAKMQETGALLAGEMSGHVFFADEYYGFDDGLYAAVRVLTMVSQSEQSLSQMMDQLPHSYTTPEMRFFCDDLRKFEVIELMKKHVTSKNIGLFCDVDGIRMQTQDGWWLVRASNTQAALVARCESFSEDGLRLLIEEVHGLLCLFGVNTGIDSTGLH